MPLVKYPTGVSLQQLLTQDIDPRKKTTERVIYHRSPAPPPKKERKNSLSLSPKKIGMHACMVMTIKHHYHLFFPCRKSSHDSFQGINIAAVFYPIKIQHLIIDLQYNTIVVRFVNISFLLRCSSTNNIYLSIYSTITMTRLHQSVWVISHTLTG